MAEIVTETIPIDQISTDGTQIRIELNQTVIAEYAQAYKEGIELPAVDVYFDGQYYLADGFHRLRALQQIGRDSITANVHPGNLRDAILHAIGSNETHGLRRTNADRRQAVMLMLNDPEWSQWSNHTIARQCMVSEISVRRARRELEPKGGERAKDETRKAERRGKVYTIQTGGIGAAKKKQPKEPAVADGRGTEPAAVAAAATQEPVALQEQPTDVLSTTLSQIDASTSTIPAVGHESSAETTPVTSTETEPDTFKVVDEAPPMPAELEHRPDEALSDATEAAAESGQYAPVPAPTSEISLEEAWGWSSHEKREAFVWQHRKQLRAMLTAREHQNVLSS